MEKIIIRNSMLKDWENLCPLAFKARWFGTPEEKQLMDIGHLESIRWGSYFEQLVFGSGVGGKTIELNQKELSSVYYKRVKRQAEEARKYLFKTMGVPFIAAQVQIFGEVEVEGVKIPLEGNVDGMFGHNKIPEMNVDTKFTADTSNEWGEYAWGKPETMDMGQLVNYKTLVDNKYGTDVKSRYYVADKSEKERVEVIEPVFSNEYIQEYYWRVYLCYMKLWESVNYDVWEARNGYNECKGCPLKNTCPKAVLSPQVKIVHK